MSLNPFKTIRDLGMDEEIPFIYRAMVSGPRSIRIFVGDPKTKNDFLALEDRHKLLTTIQFCIFSFLGLVFLLFGISGIFWGHPELLVFGGLMGLFLIIIGLPGLALASYIYKHQNDRPNN